MKNATIFEYSVVMKNEYCIIIILSCLTYLPVAVRNNFGGISKLLSENFEYSISALKLYLTQVFSFSNTFWLLDESKIFF